MNIETPRRPHYLPRLYKRAINLSSEQAKHIFLLLGCIAIAYMLIGIVYAGLSIMGTPMPNSRMEIAQPLITISILLAITNIVLMLMIFLKWIRWQFSLSLLFGLSLWSLMYLICGLIFLIQYDRLS